MTTQPPSKPTFGKACNNCGFCCTAGPCLLAQEFLGCHTGPCVALEWKEGRSQCGLARNPLAYIYQAAHPDQDVPVHEPAPDIDASRDLQATITQALGIGTGCDTSDDDESDAWPGSVKATGGARPGAGHF